MSESQDLVIFDHGAMQHLNYQGMLAYHGGQAVLGATIGYRAMQCSGGILSRVTPWDRRDLKVENEHPGPGVRDAIEYVTRCVTRNRHTPVSGQTTCNAGMKFVWRVNDGKQQVEVKLRPNILPDRFFQLLEKFGNEQESPNERQELEELKQSESKALWSLSLEELFEVHHNV